MTEHSSEAPIIPEPPVTLDDTAPRRAINPGDTQPTQTVSAPPRRGTSPFTLVLYVVALLVTAGAAYVYLQPEQPTAAPTLPPAPVESQSTTVPTVMPTEQSVQTTGAATLPDADVPVDVVTELLQAPGLTAPPVDALFRQQTAYTIAPARSRSTWISYTIQLGDTVDKIAKRFGINTDTIAWSNDITYVNRLRPGDTLTILPEDGILHTASGQETIQQIAEKYKVTPYRIIDSDYNPRLQSVGAVPETVLPAEMLVMVPGGTSEKKLLFWNPGSTIEGASAQGGGTVNFAPGQPGSCGPQPNSGGSGAMLLPLPPGSYEVTRGFGGDHSGVDLAGRAGTTVFAADSGRVLYAGWVNYGYGNVVVLGHGRIWTIYGHLSSISVSCGQAVGAGAVVGATGSTGVSSGPHLHFEIRVPAGNEWVPVSPTRYRAF